MPRKKDHQSQWNERRRRYAAAAKRRYHKEGEVEVDDNAKLSIADPPDGGAYVQAWVWVPEEEVKD
jgi:hypothetical protein